MFDQLKSKFAHDISVAIPNPKCPFHIHADSSNLGTGSISVQQFPEMKRSVSANSRVFDKAQQKMSPQQRKLCGIMSALQTYEFYIINSPYPIYLFCDYRPTVFLVSPRTIKYQVVLNKFQNLKIIYNEGKNLAFPDLLSKKVPQGRGRKFQIEHKTVPKDIRFYTSDYKPINYSKPQCDQKKAPRNTSYPVVAHIPRQ